MNICFRVDSSVHIGTGHLFRCLTLAEQLREQQATVSFAIRKEDGHTVQLLEEKGYAVFELPIHGLRNIAEEEEARDFIQFIKKKQKLLDWVIVDHYQLSAEWEWKVADELGVQIGVIDDLANRPHHCSLLLDQNYYQNVQNRYQGLVPLGCTQLLGPAYLILRSEFYQLTRERRSEKEKRMLIFFGGSDPTAETVKALQALQEIKLLEWKVDVVVGEANPKRNIIERFCQEIGARYYCQIDYLADLMQRATFSLGAGGVTMWERCYVGLPSLVTVVAENQRQSSEDTARMGGIKLLGWHEEVSKADYKRALQWALTHHNELKLMRRKGQMLFQGQENVGVHPFVAQILEGYN